MGSFKRSDMTRTSPGRTSAHPASDEGAWELRSDFDCWVSAHSALVILEGELLELAIKVGEGRRDLSELDALGLEVEERRQMCQKMLSDAMGSRTKTRAAA